MRQILTALFCISLTVNALAADVTKNHAAKVATNYFSEVLISNGQNHAAVISESFDITKDGNTVLYLFNFENGGYVIVSADDRFTPILGYSPDGYYETGNMPGGFEFFIGEFSEMIALIREENIAADPEYTAKWERYASDNPTDRGIMAVIVDPMTALWNQDYPYNFYAPTEDGGPGGRAYAGCVATAMSMIMYYWKWPWQGTGEKSYKPPKCSHGTEFPILTANFGETFYDYNGMYGTPEVTADGYLYEPIALLQYHTGIAVNMQYCKDGSGAQSATVPVAMKNYFKYDPSIQYKQKGNTSTADWATMLKGQLDLRQPVYASGCDTKPYPNTGCHAFVCDGYDSNDMFHYNFGWSGSANGYFIADKPYDFVTSVAAIINFIPDRTKGYPPDCNGNWTLSYMKGVLTDYSGPMDNYAAGTTATWLIDPSIVGDDIENITLTCNEMNLATGDYLRFYDGDNDSAPLLGEYTGSATFPTVTSGSKVLVKFTSAASSPTAKGFMLTYVAKAKKYCDNFDGITFTAPEGTFTDGSPENMNYPNGNSCKWNIYPDGAVDPDTEITFEFTRLDTEKDVDVIRFYDEKAKLLASASGTEIPEPIIVKVKKVTVIFSPNAFINGKGFEIKYSVFPVSIKEVENINDLSVYPNPASDKLNIKFNTSVADDFEITIFNITGQAVYKESLNNFMGSYYNELNIADFAQGVYLMQIKSSKGATTRKVVVQ